MSEPSSELLEAALRGDPAAVRGLVDALAPTVQTHVWYGLFRRRARARRRNVEQEVEDMVQEVFVSLFEDSGRALRAWCPARGLTLTKFVGLLADRQVATILRSGRRSPWTEDATEATVIDANPGRDQGPERSAVVRDMGESLVERLRENLSPRGIELFHLLFVDEMSVEQVCEGMQMSPDAVYAWRSRIAKLARKLMEELNDERLPGRQAVIAGRQTESQS